jgi:hypothetical protein
VQKGTDSKLRTISVIWNFTDQQLESNHDYIQWLFPLAERSVAVPDSPVLSSADIVKIRLSPTAKEALERSTKRMLDFFRSSNHWIRMHDHNHLRITRIVRSLALLVNWIAAKDFLTEVENMIGKSSDNVSVNSRHHWTNALTVGADKEN